MWACCAHGIRLAGARLPVGQDGDIVTLDEGIDAIAQVVPDVLLSVACGECAIEMKVFLALGRLHLEG